MTVYRSIPPAIDRSEHSGVFVPGDRPDPVPVLPEDDAGACQSDRQVGADRLYRRRCALDPERGSGCLSFVKRACG